MDSRLVRRRFIRSVSLFAFSVAATLIACGGGSDPLVGSPSSGAPADDGASPGPTLEAGPVPDADLPDTLEPDAGSGSKDAGPDVAKPPNRAPVILVAGANPPTLNQDQPLTITVVATDPDGIADLIGGAVKSADGTQVYGALASGAEEGSYSLTITWLALQGTESIDAPVSGKTREFQIELFDAAGTKTTTKVSTKLACSYANYGLCGGKCNDFASNAANCGVCGFDCSSGFGGSMGAGGSCSSLLGQPICKKSNTIRIGFDRPNLSCATACAQAGGAQAFSAVSNRCDLAPRAVCPTITCDTRLADLPDLCTLEESNLVCDCEAWYKPPGP